MKMRNLKMVALAAGMGLASAGVSAGSITYMDSWGFKSHYVADSKADGRSARKNLHDWLSFDRFDSSLGKLTSVHLSFKSWWGFTSKTIVGGYKPVYGAGVSSQYLRFELRDPNGAYSVHSEKTSTACEGRWVCYTEQESKGSFSDSLDLSGISLNNWIAPLNGKVNVKLHNHLAAKLKYCGEYDYCSQWNKHNYWAGKAWLTYKYEKVAEPGSLALLGLGLAGLGLVRRKQLKS